MSVFINYNYLIELYNWMAVNSLHINETKTTQIHISYKPIDLPYLFN